MALRQYVGARYVPKFSDVNGGEWDDTYTYEPLTIVKHGNDYYTSNKEVPTGIAITNTEYWVLTGNYNGAISELHDEIGVINSSILSIGGQIEDINEDIDEINSKINVESRYWLFMGDSYDTIVANNSWIDDVADYLGISSDHYYKRSHGGYGFTPNIPEYTFLNYLQSNPVDHPENITDIVICSGANDINGTYANLVSAMAAFDTYVKSIYPNLQRIHLGFIGFQASKTNRSKYVMFASWYKRAATQLGWISLNGVENIMKYTGYIDTVYSDYQHPTSDGVTALAVGIANALLTGSTRTYNKATFTLTPDSTNVTPSVDMNFTETFIDDSELISFGNIGFVANKALSGDFVLGTCAANKLSMNFSDFHMCFIYISASSKIIPALLYMSDVGTLNLYPAYDTIAQNTGFRLIANSFTEIIA